MINKNSACSKRFRYSASCRIPSLTYVYIVYIFIFFTIWHIFVVFLFLRETCALRGERETLDLIQFNQVRSVYLHFMQERQNRTALVSAEHLLCELTCWKRCEQRIEYRFTEKRFFFCLPFPLKKRILELWYDRLTLTKRFSSVAFYSYFLVRTGNGKHAESKSSEIFQNFIGNGVTPLFWAQLTGKWMASFLIETIRHTPPLCPQLKWYIIRSCIIYRLLNGIISFDGNLQRVAV